MQKGPGVVLFLIGMFLIVPKPGAFVSVLSKTLSTDAKRRSPHAVSEGRTALGERVEMEAPNLALLTALRAGAPIMKSNGK